MSFTFLVIFFEIVPKKFSNKQKLFKIYVLNYYKFPEIIMIEKDQNLKSRIF